MNSELKSAKWLWSGVALQLGVGFTIGYLVNTVGTLITAPYALNIGGTIGGAIAVAVFAIILVSLIAKNNKRIASLKK
jgi:ferrous iron transport protein B